MKNAQDLLGPLAKADLELAKETLPLVGLISAIDGFQEADGIKHTRFPASIRAGDYHRTTEVV